MTNVRVKLGSAFGQERSFSIKEKPRRSGVSLYNLVQLIESGFIHLSERATTEDVVRTEKGYGSICTQNPEVAWKLRRETKQASTCSSVIVSALKSKVMFVLVPSGPFLNRRN